ncbi:hypothetical protein TorRG33x02_302970 [Trema orientale]|uniref:Uncharacterized protein n=1 Tax=Trema orientale TaxID=63057 RepID=A0A2P5BZT3_TREOI|nr:hypothetical protein TorRG33x02_302970 [Trema orientale]
MGTYMVVTFHKEIPPNYMIALSFYISNWAVLCKLTSISWVAVSSCRAKYSKTALYLFNASCGKKLWFRIDKKGL